MANLVLCEESVAHAREQHHADQYGYHASVGRHVAGLSL